MTQLSVPSLSLSLPVIFHRLHSSLTNAAQDCLSTFLMFFSLFAHLSILCLLSLKCSKAQISTSYVGSNLKDPATVGSAFL